jgi:hypothetical protein
MPLFLPRGHEAQDIIAEQASGQWRIGPILFRHGPRRFQGGNMPLSLSTEEMDLLLELAAPINQRQRDQFLHEVAAELEANGQAGAVGIGSVHRVARTVQRRFFDPPVLGESKYRRA